MAQAATKKVTNRKSETVKKGYGIILDEDIVLNTVDDILDALETEHMKRNRLEREVRKLRKELKKWTDLYGEFDED